jgi:hypothetical protein
MAENSPNLVTLIGSRPRDIDLTHTSEETLKTKKHSFNPIFLSPSCCFTTTTKVTDMAFCFVPEV